MTLGQDDYVFMNYGYAPWQCASFAFWRMRNDLGYPNFTPTYNGGFFGDGGRWDDAARTAGFPVDGSPRRGDVCVFDPFVGGAGGYGHVAVVLEVKGAQVLLEDYNWLSDRTYRQHWSPSSGLHFIHVKEDEELAASDWWWIGRAWLEQGYTLEHIDVQTDPQPAGTTWAKKLDYWLNSGGVGSGEKADPVKDGQSFYRMTQRFLKHPNISGAINEEEADAKNEPGQ